MEETQLNQVEETQLKDINAAALFFLVLDESLDASYLSQFSAIARYVVGDALRDESLAVLPMKKTTRGKDLFGFSLSSPKKKIC